MEFIIATFGVALLVWAILCAQRITLVAGCAIFIAFGYVFNNYFWTARLGPFPLTTDRILLVCLVALFLWRCLRGTCQLRRATGTDWIGCAFVGYLTLRCAFTEPPGMVASTVPPIWRLIASFWMPAALYWIMRNAELDKRHLKNMLVGLSVLGVYLALTGIAEVKQQWWAVFPRFIANPELGTHFGRARGPALMSASLGVYLAICFWSAWFLWTQVGRWSRAAIAIAMLLMCAALYYTFTRSCWLGLAAGTAVVPLLHFPKSWRPAIVAAGILAVTAGGLFLSEKVLDLGRKDSDGDAEHSVYQRASFVYVSMRMVRDSPLVGCGFGRFYDKKMPYLADRSQKIELESIRLLDHHNTYLSILTETGVVGFALMIALLVSWFRSAWSLVKGHPLGSWQRGQGLFALAVLIVYVTNALFHDLTLSPSEQWILSLVMGATVGLQALTLSAAAPASIANSTTSFTQPPTAMRAPFTRSPLRQVSLFGMKIHAIDMQYAVETVLNWCRTQLPTCRYVVTPNVDHVVMFQTRPDLQQAYARASLVLADGAPVVWAAWLLGRPLPQRVAGSDLVPAVFDRVSSEGEVLRVFLLGAAPGVGERAASTIRSQWNNIEVVGTYSPPIGFEHDAAETQKILALLANSRPQLVLVGLGAPKQELWTSRLANQLPPCVVLCVGATIDFLAGEKSRSPRWMRHAGLEWLHRLSTEPQRLAGRYLRDAWIFPRLIWREWRTNTQLATLENSQHPL